MRGNREEPRFFTVLMNWIASGICALYGFVYGLGFLGSIYYTIIFHLGRSTEYISPSFIFVTLALALLYMGSATELYRWQQVGGILGLIANSVSLSTVFFELAPTPVPGQVIEAEYAAILPSIAIILIIFCWDHLYIEKPSNSKEF